MTRRIPIRIHETFMGDVPLAMDGAFDLPGATGEPGFIGLRCCATREWSGLSLFGWSILSLSNAAPRDAPPASGEMQLEMQMPEVVAAQISCAQDKAHRAILGLTRMINTNSDSMFDLPGLAWAKSDANTGIDMRSIFYLPNLVVICDDAITCGEVAPEVFARGCAVIAQKGLSAHEKIAMTPECRLAQDLLNRNILHDPKEETFVFDIPTFS